MDALVVIDVQNDFLEEGSLAVAHSNKIIPVINSLLDKFPLSIATQDWHPPNHICFYTNHKNYEPFAEIEAYGVKQILWPEHCIQGSEGAMFPVSLNSDLFSSIIRKGVDYKVDSYSAFHDNKKDKSTGLHGYLQDHKIKTLYFTGLAADICVYHSIQDALKLGYKCIVVTDAVAELDKEVYKKQQQELQESGVQFVQSNDI